MMQMLVIDNRNHVDIHDGEMTTGGNIMFNNDFNDDIEW